VGAQAKATGPSSRREGPSRTTLGVRTPSPSRRKKEPMGTQRQYVGTDLHRKRSVVVRRDNEGKALGTARIDNSAMALGDVLARAGKAPEVVLEACNGWYWAVDVLQDCGAKVHSAHPSATTGATDA